MDDFVEGEFVKFKRVDSDCQVDCYHNVWPGQEFHVEEIVRRISERLGCSCVVAKVSRFVSDLNREISEKNREAILEYYKVLKENVRGRKKYFLVVLHGMKNRRVTRNSVPSKLGTKVPSSSGKDIEIGIRGGRLCDKKVGEVFVSEMREEFSEFRVVVDEEFKGPKILEDYRFGNKYFEGLGEGLNVFQVELSRDLREDFRDEVVEGICRVLKKLHSL